MFVLGRVRGKGPMKCVIVFGEGPNKFIHSGRRGRCGQKPTSTPFTCKIRPKAVGRWGRGILEGIDTHRLSIHNSLYGVDTVDWGRNRHLPHLPVKYDQNV